jgi:hypothetical protein
MPSSYVSGRVMSGQTEHSRAIIVAYVPSGHYFGLGGTSPSCRHRVVCHLALRYSEGVTMRVPLYAPGINKSLSPATSKSAFARAAHSRNISSPGSRHTFTVPLIFTRMPRARIACSADVARCRSQENFFVKTRTISASISSQVAITPSLIVFRAPESACRDVSQLKRRNPDVCVDDDDHPLDRTRLLNELGYIGFSVALGVAAGCIFAQLIQRSSRLLCRIGAERFAE